MGNMYVRCPGCREYVIPAHVETFKVVGECRDRTGRVEDFIADRCTATPGARTLFGELRRAYILWCTSEKVGVCRTRDFGVALERLGFYSIRGVSNRMYRSGITLNP